ncbi:MAG: phosphoadenosine phosphosulfate reductase family protein, partial [Vicinamibacteria bacterium]
YELWRTLERRYEISSRAVRSELELEAQAKKFGDRLWERSPDLCCRLRKVEPLAGALQGKDAWITGIRREQTPERASASSIEMDPKFGLARLGEPCWSRSRTERPLLESYAPCWKGYARISWTTRAGSTPVSLA